MDVEPLARDLLADLERPEAYPHDPSAAAGVRHLQTHISHVFLTGARVVKLRKAVCLPFLDFASRAARNRDALRELQLNRRLAPDVYLGLAPLRRPPGSNGAGWRVGPLREELEPGEDPPEHALVMRRLPEGRDARSLLERGALAPAHLDAVARTLAAFHARHGLGTPAPFSPAQWLARCGDPMRANFRALGEHLTAPSDAALCRATAEASEARLAALAPALERRRQEGRAVDGHGDLHLEHVWIEDEDAPPRLIDCIEFDDELRRGDAAAEVAFLAMDLTYRERPDLAARFLARYAEERDDFGLFDVVDLFASYRAGVRAKVAALASAEAEIAAAQRAAAAQSARRHLALAHRLLAAPSPGLLVLVCGTVGVGKSSAARALAAALEAVPIASDPTRKRLAGLAPTARDGAAAGEGAGMYTAERTEAVYEGLLARAEPVLRSGRTALLDATWSRRRHREAARARAARLGADFAVVHVDCDAARARARVAGRARAGTDASDAGPERVAISRARFEPLDEVPSAARYEVRSDAGLTPDVLEPLVAALRARRDRASPGRANLQSKG